MLDAATDDDLIAAIARGDTTALATLHDRHGAAIRSVARAVAREAEVEDVVQDTFLAVLEAAHTYRPSGACRPWLFAIARNAGRRRHRRDREVGDASLFELGLAAGWGAPEQALSAEADADALARAIASLPPAEREVVILRDVEGWSGEDSADALGLGVSALKSRLHRARLRLMATLREEARGVVTHEREVGGMTCAEVLAELGDYVDGDTPTERRAAIDAHLLGCTVCERFGGRYAHVVHGARERLGARPTYDAASFERVRAALSCRDRSTR